MNPKTDSSRHLLLGEWACLGILYPTASHGFAIAARLKPEGDVGRVWSLSRALTYRSLEQLTDRGYIHAVGEEPGIAGGNRTILACTRTGRAQLRRWLQTPVTHLRDLRSELLLKLIIAEICSVDIRLMLERQHGHIEQMAKAIDAQPEVDTRTDVVALWRHESSNAALRFVDRLLTANAHGDVSDQIVIRRARPDLSDASALGEVLVDCVEGGASVGFMLPLGRERANAFWVSVLESAARGERIILIAEESNTGNVLGTAQLILTTPENQSHRGDISKMLVRRDARRRGVAEALMRAVEQAAVEAGKNLLVLDTASAEAERLYTRLGWVRVGVISDYALSPGGGFVDAVFFCKYLSPKRTSRPGVAPVG